MARRGNPLEGLAASVLAMERQGGGVPPQVRASARRILDQKGSPSDAQNIRQFLGTVRTGAGGIRRAGGQVGGAIGQAGSYAGMIGGLTQGPLSFASASTGLVGNISSDVEKLAKNRTFVRLIEKSVGVVVGLPQQAGSLASRLSGGAIGTERNNRGAPGAAQSFLQRLQEGGARTDLGDKQQVQWRRFSGEKTSGLTNPETGEKLSLSAALGFWKVRFRKSKGAGGPDREYGESALAGMAELTERNRLGRWIGGAFGAPGARINPAVIAARIGYGIRAGARFLGAAASFTGAAVGGGYAVAEAYTTLGQITSGRSANPETTRQAEMNARATLGNPQATSREREIARIELQQQRNRLTGWGSAPGVGEFFARRKDYEKGGYEDAAYLGRLQSESIAQQHRVGSMGFRTSRELARDRVYAAMGDPENVDVRLKGMWLNSGRPDRAHEDAVTAAHQKMASDAETYQNDFHRLAALKNFQAARNVKAMANENLPGTIPRSMSPQDSYKMQESSRISNRMWVISNSPRAGAREWDW